MPPASLAVTAGTHMQALTFQVQVFPWPHPSSAICSLKIDLTSRRAHLMQFQLPQTIPQPQRPRECGITVGRQGAAASRDAQSRGVRKPRPAATRRPGWLGLAVPPPLRLRPLPGPEREGSSPHTLCWLRDSGEGEEGYGASPAYLSGARCPLSPS